MALNLTLGINELVTIDGDIRLVVRSIHSRAKKIKVSIDAPKSKSIVRDTAKLKRPRGDCPECLGTGLSWRWGDDGACTHCAGTGNATKGDEERGNETHSAD